VSFDVMQKKSQELPEDGADNAETRQS